MRDGDISGQVQDLVERRYVELLQLELGRDRAGHSRGWFRLQVGTDM